MLDKVRNSVSVSIPRPLNPRWPPLLKGKHAEPRALQYVEDDV